MKSRIFIASFVALIGSTAIAQTAQSTSQFDNAIVRRVETAGQTRLDFQLKSGNVVSFVDQSKRLEKLRGELNEQDFQNYMRNNPQLSIGGGWQPELNSIAPTNELIVELIKSLPRELCNSEGVAQILGGIIDLEAVTLIDVTLMPSSVKSCLR